MNFNSIVIFLTFFFKFSKNLKINFLTFDSHINTFYIDELKNKINQKQQIIGAVCLQFFKKKKFLKNKENKDNMFGY